MKKEVHEFKSLMEYLEKLSKNEVDILYQKLCKKRGNKKSLKKNIEEIYSKVIADLIFIIGIKGNDNFKDLDDIINGNQPKSVDKSLIDNLFVVKTDDGYITFKEVEEIYKKSKSNEVVDEKKAFVFSHYVLVNGVVEQDKLIELMEKTGFKITKTEIKKYAKEYHYTIKDNLIYSNFIAEDLNENNLLMELKQNNDYKVFKFEEITTYIMTSHLNDTEAKIKDILKKKIKNSNDIDEISYMIINRVIVGDEYLDDVNELLTSKNIKLGKQEMEFYDLLEEHYYFNPHWTLNGYAPYELDNDNYLKYQDDEFNLEDTNDYKKIFNIDELISVIVYIYLTINGVIKMEDLLNIINENYSEDVSKNKLVKFIKKEPTLKTIDDYIVIGNLSKEDIKYILSSKKINDFYIVDDFDEFEHEYIESENKLLDILDKYDLSSHFKDDIIMMANYGIFNEMVLECFLEENAICLTEKMCNKLYSDLKKCINNMHLWYLNGFTPNDIGSVNKKDKVGRNDPCPCGSGKKYKQCCGK